MHLKCPGPLTVLALVGFGLGLTMASATVAVLTPVLVAGLGRERRRLAARRRDQQLLASLPGLVDLTMAQLHSGRSLAWSWGHARHRWKAEQPAGALSSQGLGSPVDRAVGLVEATVASLAEAGGPAVPGLQRLRYTLVGFVEAEREAALAATQAVASASLLCAAPVLFALLAAVVEPALARLYLYRTFGLVCALVSVSLIYGGWLWMIRTVEAATKPLRADNRWSRPATRRRRLDDQRRRELAPTVDLLAVCLGAGRNLSAALAVVANSGPEVVRPGFVAVLDRCRGGKALPDAIPGLGEVLGTAYHPLVAALVVNAQGGSPLGVLLQRLADDAEASRRHYQQQLSRRMPVALLPPLAVCMLPAIIIGTLIPLAAATFSNLAPAL